MALNKYEFICNYCNYNWQTNYMIREPACSRCKDTNIKTKDLTAEKIDYYVGCPPFEEDVFKSWNT